MELKINFICYDIVFKCLFLRKRINFDLENDISSDMEFRLNQAFKFMIFKVDTVIVKSKTLINIDQTFIKFNVNDFNHKYDYKGKYFNVICLIYGFFLNDYTLKVGKMIPNSNLKVVNIKKKFFQILNDSIKNFRTQSWKNYDHNSSFEVLKNILCEIKINLSRCTIFDNINISISSFCLKNQNSISFSKNLKNEDSLNEIIYEEILPIGNAKFIFMIYIWESA